MKNSISLLLLPAITGLSSSVLAGSATWLANPQNGDWNTAANWTEGGPPNGESDIATFDTSSVTNIALSQETRLDGIAFQPEANGYTLTLDTIYLFGSGITNSSENTQRFILGFGGNLGGGIFLENNARIGANTSFTMGGDAGDYGGIFFSGNSSAGDGVYYLNACDHLSGGGYLVFDGTSSAGNATILLSGSNIMHCPVGLPGCDNPYPQGNVFFETGSTAANATLIARGGIGDGSGGAIFFRHSSSGGTARIELLGNSYLDLSQHNVPGLTIGSLEGSGDIYLDDAFTESGRTLTIGSNNLSTNFSGTFVGLLRPSLGSMTKIGTGTLTISSELAYFGDTIIQGGRLQVNGSISNSAIRVDDGGTLGGSGTVQSVSVDDGGTVAPGDGMHPLRVTGSYSGYGVLKFEVANADPTAPAQIDFGGETEIGGTLEVRFTNGFLPASGQVFKLFHLAVPQSPSFSRMIFPDLRSGFQVQGDLSVDGYYQITASQNGVPAAGFLNISTRMQVGTDDNALIAGFIIIPSANLGSRASRDGSMPNGASKRVILRAIGPSLMVDGEPLPGRLEDPVLELRDSTGAVLASNDNWMESAQRQEIIDTGIPPAHDNEAAIVATLADGSYTAIMRGANNTTGIGVVEVYDLSPEVSSKVANISTRGLVGDGDNAMIGGFIVDNQATHVIIRALGPSLAQSGVPNPLADPYLELRDSEGSPILLNYDWQQDDQAAIEGSGFAPTNEKESAILTTLSPGPYTALVRGQIEPSGVALIEVYQLQ